MKQCKKDSERHGQREHRECKEKETCCYQEKRIKALNALRLQFPNDPINLGSSTNPAVLPFEDWHTQAGNVFSSACKFEYDSKTNKYSIPSLKVTTVFNLVPSSEEAGEYESDILAVGYAPTGSQNGWPRDLSSVWYPATQDNDNFYYSVNGGSLFGAYFGFGTSSLFICRRKKDAKLVWARNSKIYRIDNPNQPTFFGSTNVLSRVTPAIYGDRLYITSLVTNIGPQLFCINKKNGNPIWSIAYDIPAQMALDIGAPTLGAPNNVAFNSFNGATYIGQSVSLGDANLNIAKLSSDSLSVFVGISSFQNAFNPQGFLGFAFYTDQGKLLRIDDKSSFGELLWASNNCAPLLKVGDQISNTGPDNLNPFRPGANSVYIWRETTSSGTFDAVGGVNAAILDYNGANPGYIPLGYPTENNLTTPIVANLVLVGGNPPLTETSVQNVFRSAPPGIGADARIYWTFGGFEGTTNGPVTITDFLVSANDLQSDLAPGAFLKVILWAYVDIVTVTDVNVIAWGQSNAGVRYIAALPNNYVISNSQEAEALNYFGNSVWGQSCVIDVGRNLAYYGSGQTHGGPVDELLTYQDPAIEYLERKQPLINTIYQYARPDESTDAAPFSTLEDVNAAKDAFIAQQETLNLNTSLRSPRGNMSYCDAMFGVDLDTGKKNFAYRVLDWDQVTFTGDDISLLVIQSGFADSDVSSGLQLLENVTVEDVNAGKRTFLATVHKGSMVGVLDISGLNPNVEFNGLNLLEKGVVPHLAYAGPDGVLGGSNYGLTQDGGSRIIWKDANNAPNFGSFSKTYNTGYYQGYEFHVTRDGRIFLPNNSYVASYDVGTRQIVWETLLGQLTLSQINSFNGVSFVPRGDGVLFGLDNGTGQPIYKADFLTPYGMAGSTPPTFDDKGNAVFMNNFPLPIIADIGELGGKAVLLKVDPCLLTSPKDDVNTLVSNKVFNSFDVLPKARNVTVELELRNDQTVQHSWGHDGSLTATHVLFDYVNGNPVVIDTLTAKFKAKNFVYASGQILFNNFPTQNGLRYISLTMLTRKTYILEFQLIKDDTVTNCQATLEVSERVCKKGEEKKEEKSNKIQKNNKNSKNNEKVKGKTNDKFVLAPHLQKALDRYERKTLN